MKDYTNRIFLEDCLEGMRRLPEGSIDAVVTSPPYNIGMQYDTYRDNMPFGDYLDWMKDVAHGCHRVLKEGGSFFLNIGDKPSDEFRSYRVAERISGHFYLQNTIHWIKSIAVPEHGINIGHFKPVNSRRFLNGCHEYIFHFARGGCAELDREAVGVPYKDKSNVSRWGDGQEDVRCRGNVWFIPYETTVGAKPHPAAFPVRLPEMCLLLCGAAEEHLTVLDPFMGSGSTAVAAAGLGCGYVGFEVDEGYAKAARERVRGRNTDTG